MKAQDERTRNPLGLRNRRVLCYLKDMDIKNILLNGSLEKSVFDSYFKDIKEQLRTCINGLPKVKVGDIDKGNGDFAGIYILWKEEKPIYVGRAQKQMIYQRIANHRSANPRTSSFVLRLTREKVASSLKDPEYLCARYGGKKGKTAKEVVEQLNEEIKREVKNEINDMGCSWIKVCNPLHQAYLEILCSVALETAPLEDMNDNKIFKKEGENYRYLYYNSFDTS